MNDGRDRLDLVLPVYNEAHVLESTINRLFEASENWKRYDWRIEIVDNASLDGTDKVGRRLAEQYDTVCYRRIDRKGRGYALRESWNETDARYSLYMDVDLSTGLEAVGPAVALLESGADLVTGSRLHPDSQVTRSFKREVFSRVYNFVVKIFFWSRGFSDAQCGFKGIRLDTIRPLLPLVKNNNWFFDTELMILAEHAGLRVQSLPITWVEDIDTRVVIPQYVLENLRGLMRTRFTVNRLLRSRKWS